MEQYSRKKQMTDIFLMQSHPLYPKFADLCASDIGGLKSIKTDKPERWSPNFAATVLKLWTIFTAGARAATEVKSGDEGYSKVEKLPVDGTDRVEIDCNNITFGSKPGDTDDKGGDSS